MFARTFKIEFGIDYECAYLTQNPAGNWGLDTGIALIRLSRSKLHLYQPGYVDILSIQGSGHAYVCHRRDPKQDAT